MEKEKEDLPGDKWYCEEWNAQGSDKAGNMRGAKAERTVREEQVPLGMLCWSSTSEHLAGDHTGHCCNTGAEHRTYQLLDAENICVKFS